MSLVRLGGASRAGAGSNPVTLLILFLHARSDNTLTGTLDPGLGRGWPLVEHLDLGTNQLRGPIPASFAAMGRLKNLHLK